MVRTTTAVIVAFAFGIAGSRFAMQQNQDAPPGAPDGQFLVEALKKTEGCVGVETAQTSSGKNCIIGFFKDKQSVINWYNSATHQFVMSPMTASVEGYEHKPLAHVADDAGPIMVIASITPSEVAEIEGFPFPISQISIELFEALPGGAMVNGRLAPDGFAVEHMRDYTP